LAYARNIGKGSRTLSKREQRRINAGKNLQRRIVTSTLHGITDIRVLIHRSVFSGQYSLAMLQRKLGFGVQADGPFEEYSRYSYRRNIQLGTGRAGLHFKFPSDGYGPSCLITTNKSTYDHLLNIHNRLPKLKITRLEYAIDLICRDHDAVSDLLWLVKRYIYAPNAIQTSMAGGKFWGYQDRDRAKNAVYYIWMHKYSGKHIKVYERGPDSKRIPGTPKWRHKDVDRVRIEFKLRRTAITKKYGLSTLKQLLLDPKFADIAREYIQFKNFKFSSELPQDSEDYLSEDDEGNQESFVQEALAAKDNTNLKNLLQYIEDNQRMQALKKRILKAAIAFDKHWGRGSRRLKG
jgi:hypothetical protein